MDGAKTQGILQPTEDSGLDIRQLPGHDFADSRLFVTPSAFRFMTFKTETIDNDGKLVVNNDNSVASIRSKYYRGSTGTVWASDDIQNRIKRPELHEIDDNGHNIAARKVFAAITMYIPRGGHFHSKVIGMLVAFLGYKILILVFLGSSGKFLEN